MTPFKGKCATDTGPTQTVTLKAAEMFKALANDTGGAIQIDFFPNSTLGNSSQLPTQLRAGSIDFLIESGSAMQGLDPICNIENVGFAFKDSAAGYRAMDGPLGQFIQKRLAEKNVYLFNKVWGSGFAQNASSVRAFQKPEDFSGLKIRTSASKVIINLISTLGGSPATIPLAEVYTSLQSKLVDGLFITLGAFEALHFYEVQKYLSITNSVWSTYYFMANLEMWNRAPSDVKTMIMQYAERYALAQRRDSDAVDATLATKLASQGMIVNKPDPQPFRAKLAPHYAFCKDLFGNDAWALLEQSVGKLG